MGVGFEHRIYLPLSLSLSLSLSHIGLMTTSLKPIAGRRYVAMAAAIARAASKRIASLAVPSAPKNVPGVKGLHSTASKQMSSSHDSHSYDDYLHAEHMYNLPGMKHRKLKMGLAVFAVVAIGTGVPIFAVHFQQKKAMIS